MFSLQLKKVTHMDFFEVIKKRRSVRVFKQKPVQDDLVKKILEAACWAPSAGNMQSWEFIIVKDPKIKTQLCTAALDQEMIEEAPLDIVVCANQKRSAIKQPASAWHWPTF